MGEGSPFLNLDNVKVAIDNSKIKMVQNMEEQELQLAQLELESKKIK